MAVGRVTTSTPTLWVEELAGNRAPLVIKKAHWMYDMAVDLVADEWNSFIQTFAFCPIIKKNNLSKVFYSSDGQVLSAQV